MIECISLMQHSWAPQFLQEPMTIPLANRKNYFWSMKCYSQTSSAASFHDILFDILNDIVLPIRDDTEPLIATESWRQKCLLFQSVEGVTTKGT